MKQQVLIIGGGDTFKTYEEYIDSLKTFEIDIERFKSDKTDWKPWLRKNLGDEYEVVIPQMPNKTNAQYVEWKIWFEKILNKLNKEIILIGHSLGGAFLSKYLTENKIDKDVKAVFLVAAVYEYDSDGNALFSFQLPKTSISLQTDKIYLYHSKDDPVVPFSELYKYTNALPNAEVRVLEDKRHINQEQFPELLNDIMSIK
jgi:predicted alpha/beta hydrolase family esterase